MPRRVHIVELRDIVQRLRLGHSVKAIHRETGRHRTLIRAMRDLAALSPLPLSRWDPVIFKEASVGPDWRVQFQKAFYSVPYRLIGERVLQSGGKQ